MKMTQRFNSVRHGLLRKKILLMPDESRYLYNKLNSKLVEVWQPLNLAETMLVEQLCFNYWRLKRGFSLETQFLQKAKKEADGYTTQNKHWGNSTETFAVEYLNFDKFDKFSRYITSIQRQILRILHELERLQAMRKGQNVPLPIAMDVDIERGEV